MQGTEHSLAPDAPPDPAAKARYRRGVESRERILVVALSAFGLKGFEAVSTRDIAQAAGVNQPAIQYYFGNKEGLYLDCARHIVARFVEANLRVSAAALEAVSTGQSPQACRDHLLDVLTTLGRFLVDSQEAPGWSLFVQRELASPGPAFDILFEQLWRPGVELVAQLINCARGRAPDTEGAQTEAIHLIAGITGFASGRPAIHRFYAVPPTQDEFAGELSRLIAGQVARI
jgi:AcrR family transcriptional regulator